MPGELGRDALTATARLRVELKLPSVVHDVPLRALERWKQISDDEPKGLPSEARRRSPKLGFP